MVERLLSMQEAQGSIPCFSIFSLEEWKKYVFVGYLFQFV